MIKLIASDIDGTLVKDGTPDLNPEYFEIIQELKKKDIIFAAASGRQYASIASLFKPVVDDMIVIAENGAYVNCRGYDILADVIEPDTIKEMIADIRTIPGCEVMLCGRKAAYSESKNEEYLDWLVEGYKINLIRMDDLMEIEDEIIKVSLYHPEDAEGVAADFFLPKWRERMQAVSAGREWVDCMNPTANKGTAIESIQKTLNIKPEETMVFGDNMNDIEMLKYAKYSYAIGNAREEVKEAANYIADTNENHGVLQELKKLL